MKGPLRPTHRKQEFYKISTTFDTPVVTHRTGALHKHIKPKPNTQNRSITQAYKT